MAEHSPEPAPADAHETDGLPFMIAGVGASAGGLEAYTELLDGLSPSPGLALLLVSHLDPEQKSHLAPILSRSSRMPVIEVSEGMAVEANHVYVIPPGTNMAMTDGHLSLTRDRRGRCRTCRSTICSARWRRSRKDDPSACILSGNGSDGVIAMQAIKAAGGVTFAQDEVTARYPSMPRAAVLDGNVDHVMRPREIAEELERIAHHPYTASPNNRWSDRGQSVRTRSWPSSTCFAFATTVDFTHYKQTTIAAACLRRMALRNIREPGGISGRPSLRRRRSSEGCIRIS